MNIFYALLCIFAYICFIAHYNTINSGHKIIHIHTNNIMYDVQLLFELPIIRLLTFHQTSLSLYIYLLYISLYSGIFIIILASRYIYSFHIYTEYSLRGTIHKHTHTHTYILFYLYVQYPNTPVSLSTFIDHLNPFSLSLSLLPFTIICILQILLRYIILYTYQHRSLFQLSLLSTSDIHFTFLLYHKCKRSVL